MAIRCPYGHTEHIALKTPAHLGHPAEFVCYECTKMGYCFHSSSEEALDMSAKVTGANRKQLGGSKEDMIVAYQKAIDELKGRVEKEPENKALEAALARMTDLVNMLKNEA